MCMCYDQNLRDKGYSENNLDLYILLFSQWNASGDSGCWYEMIAPFLICRIYTIYRQICNQKRWWPDRVREAPVRRAQCSLRITGSVPAPSEERGMVWCAW